MRRENAIFGCFKLVDLPVQYSRNLASDKLPFKIWIVQSKL